MRKFATLIAVFESPSDLQPSAFEALLWQQLQQLHDADEAPWDNAVSSNPDNPHFSFSFPRTAFFIVGLHPASDRLSRRFPWPALVFNPHAQFERLRAEDRWERMQHVNRAREIQLQGAINPVLRDFGKESEARQYSGCPVEASWRAPFHAQGGLAQGDLAKGQDRPDPGKGRLAQGDLAEGPSAQLAPTTDHAISEVSPAGQPSRGGAGGGAHRPRKAPRGWRDT